MHTYGRSVTEALRLGFVFMANKWYIKAEIKRADSI